MNDRRKFNFNLMITAILLFLFGIMLYNQKLILNMTSHIQDIDNKIDQYFRPIDNIPLPEWEKN
jgi:cell division protein FtsL